MMRSCRVLGFLIRLRVPLVGCSTSGAASRAASRDSRLVSAAIGHQLFTSLGVGSNVRDTDLIERPSPA